MLKKCSKKKGVGENFKYFCEICLYGCKKPFLMRQHEATKRHINAYMLIGKNNDTSALHICNCGKHYKHIQSYNRHLKSCKFVEDSKFVEDNKLVNSNDHESDKLCRMISTLIQQNNSIIVENGEMRKIVKEMLPMVGSNNTTVNAQFNIQMFLNEECKDAINLTDFIQTLKLNSSDLDVTRVNGYADGIASIFLRGMRQLELHKRPIHCSDIKREVLYVKDNNIWEKESLERPKIKNAITTIAKKQVDAIKEWEEKHPTWRHTDSGTNSYCEMVREVTSGGENDNDNRIIRSIAKEVVIEKISE
jgi:hypothetical protein